MEQTLDYAAKTLRSAVFQTVCLRRMSEGEGYVADGHDSANSFLLRLEPGVALTDSIVLTTYVGNSWVIGRELTLPGDPALEAFIHGGIGFSWSFGNQLIAAPTLNRTTSGFE